MTTSLRYTLHDVARQDAKFIIMLMDEAWKVPEPDHWVALSRLANAHKITGQHLYGEEYQSGSLIMSLTSNHNVFAHQLTVSLCSRLVRSGFYTYLLAITNRLHQRYILVHESTHVRWKVKIF